MMPRDVAHLGAWLCFFGALATGQRHLVQGALLFRLCTCWPIHLECPSFFSSKKHFFSLFPRAGPSLSSLHFPGIYTCLLPRLEMMSLPLRAPGAQPECSSCLNPWPSTQEGLRKLSGERGFNIG